jgi:hypothetical protein
MLKQEHYEVASDIFGTDDFDRLFVLHAINMNDLVEHMPPLEENGIHLLTVKQLLHDLQSWYLAENQPAALRNDLIGDMVHLLFGYCGVRLPDQNQGGDHD